VGKVLSIEGNPALETLAGLGMLETVGGALRMVEDPQLRSLEGLESLTAVGTLAIGNNEGLTSLSGMKKLKTVHDFLNVSNNSQLVSLAGLGDVQDVGAVVVEFHKGLTSLAGLEGLTKLISLDVHNNDALTTLAGLDNIVSVEQKLAVETNVALSTLGPLLDWPADAIVGGFHISGNTSLPQCEVDAFDQAQTNPLATCGCNGNAGTGTCK
jgi:hypothetical protein